MFRKAFIEAQGEAKSLGTSKFSSDLKWLVAMVVEGGVDMRLVFDKAFSMFPKYSCLLYLSC